MSLEDTAKEAIDLAIDDEVQLWGMEQEWDNQNDEYYFLLSRNFRKIFLYRDWVSFDTLFSSRHTYGHFGEQFLRVKARYEEEKSYKKIKEDKEKEEWIRKVFL